MSQEFQVEALISFFRGEPSMRRHRLVVLGLVIVICAAVLAELQPDATRALPFAWSFLHWVSHIIGAIVIVSLIAWTAISLGLQDLWAIGLAVLLLPLGLAPLSLGVEAIIAQSTGIAKHQPDGFLEELSNVAIPAIGLTSLAVFLVLKIAEFTIERRAWIFAHVPKEPDLRSLFPDVPHSLGADLISVSANDHYVHFRTSDGTAMVNHRFSDCVETLSQLDGMQVHRSHWVRVKHINRVVPNGSSYVCVMQDGTEIPVSRRRYADLKHTLANQV